MKKHYLYQIICLVPNENGVCKIYSGIRSCDCPIEDDDYFGSGVYLNNAIEKHGKENFMKIIVGTYETREIAFDAETVWLEKKFDLAGRNWKVFNSMFYNLRLNKGANDTGSMSESTIQLMSQQRKGKHAGDKNPFHGRKHTEESINKMKKSLEGRVCPESTKAILKERALSGEFKIGAKGEDNAMYGRTGVDNPTFKGSIIATNKSTGETIVLNGYTEIKAAGFLPTKVYLCANGKRHTHKNHTFTRM